MTRARSRGASRGGGCAAVGPVLAVLLLLGAGPAFSEPRFDHQGAVGLIAATGASFFDQASFGSGAAEHGLRIPAQLLLTLPVGYEGNELAFGGQLGFRDSLDVALLFGLRDYFSQGREKSYLGLSAVGHLTPFWAVGARFALGYQHELTPVVGLFGELGLELGVGQGLRGDAQVLVGIQLRSYLLD